jgi:hypothetical protein
MRFLGPRTHVLYALAAAAGLVISLGRPWYAPAAAAPSPSDGAVGDLPDTISQFLAGLSRSVTEGGGPSGAEQLHTAGSFLLALAAILAVCAVGALVPALRRGAASGAKLASLLALATVLLAVIDQPGGRDVVEARVGGWIALASVVVGFAAALRLDSGPQRRRRPTPAGRRFQPTEVAAATPARPVWDDSAPTY